jgi:hypothetical protein
VAITTHTTLDETARTAADRTSAHSNAPVTMSKVLSREITSAGFC